MLVARLAVVGMAVSDLFRYFNSSREVIRLIVMMDRSWTEEYGENSQFCQPAPRTRSTLSRRLPSRVPPVP